MVDGATIRILSDADIVLARQRGRALAGKLGFSATDQITIATAISELARNIVEYATHGEIIVCVVETRRNGSPGLQVTARDDGPGIPDVALAMRDGYSTSRGLGLGLPGTRRLVDEFDISSAPGKGTTVTVRKWPR